VGFSCTGLAKTFEGWKMCKFSVLRTSNEREKWWTAGIFFLFKNYAQGNENTVEKLKLIKIALGMVLQKLPEASR